LLADLETEIKATGK